MKTKSNAWVLYLAAILIAIATLYPFKFTRHPAADRAFEIGLETAGEIVENVLLFIPFGFGLALVLSGRGRPGSNGALAVVTAASFAYSFLIESLQLLIPGRYSTLADLFSNGAGGALGFLALALWNRRWRAALTAYAVCGLVLMVPLARTSALSSWSLGYPLLVGNEFTGDRPWEGAIRELILLDRALSAAEVSRLGATQGDLPPFAANVVAHYPLSSNQDLRDHSGHLPDLRWALDAPGAKATGGVSVRGGHWLQSRGPVPYLASRLRRTSQFTLSARMATGSAKQGGPARIISVSLDTAQRNFTLAQERIDLVFRLRTPLTRENGVSPMLVVPAVFSGTAEHHVVVTYGGGALIVYVDGVPSPHKLELNAGTALCQLIRGETRPGDSRACELAYRAFILIPSGLLAARTLTSPGFFFLSMPLLLELCAALALRRAFQWEWVAVGAALTLAAAAASLIIRRVK